MTGKTIAPFGAWESPFRIELLTAGVVALGEIKAAEGVRWWLEGRPDEKGRQVLVRRDADGKGTRLTPEGFNVRTRVHEYGGAAYVVAGDLVVVSDFSTGRLHRVVAPGELEPLTEERAWRFADFVLDEVRGRLIAVREDHEPDTIARHGEAENALVSIDLATGAVSVLIAGADFVAAPRLSPDGRQLAWLEWNHPNMPWDGTDLHLAGVAADGSLGTPETIAGSPTDWISQPRWSPDGVLHFAAEPTGWMNLYRWVCGRAEPVAPLEAEVVYPDWLFGYSSYVFLADGSIVATGRSGGRERLYRIGPDSGTATQIDVPFTEMSSLAADGNRVVLRATSPTSPSAIIDLDPASGEWTVLRRSMTTEFDPEDVSEPESVEFSTTGGKPAFGLFYPPRNRAIHGPDGELPPLIVTSHGGPTATAFVGLAVATQLFTSRGFAVLDVDYGGSTGYGREYRKRLEGEWGVVDVDDCVNGASWLAEQGLVDERSLAIRGGSASGYTTLCAVTFRDTFKAGTSYFGIGDLETFETQTHKFESRYTGSLVGPYPERKDLYYERSPLNFVDRISCPVLILQGAEDRVVPPAQAEQIVDALWEKHLPHAYLLFPGEDHGFRAAENIIRSFEAELSFYGQVFGFEPADAIEPIKVEFLDAAASADAPAAARRSAAAE
ncbi:MAG TPA: prolyl oligopeptidase family serine peptidase [Candidatus Limnocylindrales bacterium]|jgi:dipeptidyl aminopeptidase/acylaminoacyl peptidase|nr:prolyl oligopeptidase family serine peptidase [Candidatus Limnocylindrales bacterium]